MKLFSPSIAVSLATRSFKSLMIDNIRCIIAVLASVILVSLPSVCGNPMVAEAGGVTNAPGGGQAA